MTRDEILAICRSARDVGTVKHEDFIDYIVVLESRRRVGEEWQAVEHAYMAVDGKLAMSNEDHRKQGQRLDFGEPKVLLDNPEQLTLQVTVTSEIYGARHGIATSCKKGGTNAEREFPWKSRRPRRSAARWRRWAMACSLARVSPAPRICCA